MIAGTPLLPLRGAGRPGRLPPSPVADADLPARPFSLHLKATPDRAAEQLPERPRTRLRLAAPHLAFHLVVGLAVCLVVFFFLIPL